MCYSNSHLNKSTGQHRSSIHLLRLPTWSYRYPGENFWIFGFPPMPGLRTPLRLKRRHTPLTYHQIRRTSCVRATWTLVLKNRILRPLEALLEQMGIIDDLVPSIVTASISSLLKDIAMQVLEREFDVVWMLQNVARIVSNAITTLESSLSVDKTSLGTGKLNLITRRYSDNQLAGRQGSRWTSSASPRVLYRYATDLQESQVYEPVGQEGGRGNGHQSKYCSCGVFLPDTKSDWS